MIRKVYNPRVLISAFILTFLSMEVQAQTYQQIDVCGDVVPMTGLSPGYMDRTGHICITSTGNNGGGTNLTEVANMSVATGVGASDGSTQRTALSTDSMVGISGQLPGFATPPTVVVSGLSTLSVTQGTTPWITQITGEPTVALDPAATIALTGPLPAFASPPTVVLGGSSTVNVTQGTSPWVTQISGSLPSFASTPAVTVSGTPTVNQGTSPWVTGLTGTLPPFASPPAVTVSGTPSVSIAGTVTLGGTLPAFAVTPAVTVSGTPTVVATQGTNPWVTTITGSLPAFASTPAVTVSGTPTVTIGGSLPAFAATPSVTVTGTPTVAISNTPTVTANQGTSPWVTAITGTLPAFASTPAFTVSGTPAVTISGTPAVAISGTLPAFATTPSVTISGVPTVAISGTPTVVATQGTNPWVTQITGTLPAFAATPAVTVSGTPTVAISGTPSVTTKNGSYTIVPFTVASVTTSGTAVTALTSGQRTAGGYLITANAVGMCVSENGTAGTTTAYASGVETVCVPANTRYTLAASTNAVSVNALGTSVAFSGYGLQ